MTTNTENTEAHEMNEDTVPAEDLANLFMGTSGQFCNLSEDPVPLMEEQ